MMSFKCEQIRIPMSMWKEKYSDAYVWYRDSGNRVIVVIDDEWDWCRHPWSEVPRRKIIYPLLKEGACALSDIQAIGFFPLAADKSDAHKVLEEIKKWLDGIKKREFRVYFLVDVISDHSRVINSHLSEFNPEIAYQSTIAWLEKNGYPLERIRNLTYSGGDVEVLDPNTDFQKMPEALYIRDHCKKFSPRFMEFLGIGLHKDEIIDNAIQFYAKAWNEDWRPKGWDHNALEKECSDHSKALADWLGIDVNDLCNWEDGESAKALMIWVGRPDLWGSRRTIQGNVLKAAMKKLEIPLSETSFPDETLINMPCTPCFPFLVSLRSFLLRCEEKGAPVKEIQFIQNKKKCIFRLMMNLDNPEEFENRFRETFREHGKKPPNEHTFTRSLIYLVYCMTEGLPNDMGRDYIRLFTDGTENPVVQVTIEKGGFCFR